MRTRTASRAVTTAIAVSLAIAGVAVADSVSGDADTVASGVQGMVYLGTVPAGSTHTVDIGFELVCTGLNHVPAGTAIELTPTTQAPLDGTIAATAATLGPVPDAWPDTGDGCVGDPVLDATQASHVTLTAPTVAGTGYVYRITYARAPGTGTSGTTLAQIALSVSGNTPPVLDLPADMTVEADVAGGWIAAFGVTASDDEDDPDPVATCSPSPGDVLPMGDTAVTCATTDSGGLTATGTFEVHVVDTTPPVFGGLPDRTVTTTDPAGAVATWPAPAASDVADSAPAVSCSPSSGSWFPVGTTTVTCTATDASGNSDSTSFAIRVVRQPAVQDPAVVLVGAWGRPLHDTVPALVGRAGRTIPLKLFVTRNGGAQGRHAIAAPVLRIAPLDACGGTAAADPDRLLGSLTWSGGAWRMQLRTGKLGPGCWRLEASVDGTVVATAVIQLRGHPSAGATHRKR
jgi:HYR domain